MADFKDVLTGLIFGTVLKSADNMGVKPILLGCQSAKVLGPIIATLSQQFIGKAPPKDMNELMTDMETMAKVSGVLGKEFEMSYTGNTVKMKTVECPWLEMAKYGKSIGYKACPLCGIMILLIGAIEFVNTVQVSDVNVDNNETVCQLTVETEQK